VRRALPPQCAHSHSSLHPLPCPTTCTAGRHNHTMRHVITCHLCKCVYALWQLFLSYPDFWCVPTTWFHVRNVLSYLLTHIQPQCQHVQLKIQRNMQLKIQRYPKKQSLPAQLQSCPVQGPADECCCNAAQQLSQDVGRHCAPVAAIHNGRTCSMPQQPAQSHTLILMSDPCCGNYASLVLFACVQALGG
jgi:hypothetical protein